MASAGPPRCELPLAGEGGGYLGNGLKAWADGFHPVLRAGVGRVVLEGKTMARRRSVKPVAGADVGIESVLKPFLGLCGGNRVRNKSPLTPRGCGRGAMQVDLSTPGMVHPKEELGSLAGSKAGTVKIN